MKKRCLIVLVTAAAMLFGLGGLALAQSSVVAQVPGNTVVQDPEDDLLLRNCNPDYPWIPCSLPPSAPLDLPGYFDIKKAKITQIGRGLVDLSINLYEPIPAEPPYGFVSYIWQFKGGCLDPQEGNKDSISVVWQKWENETWEWRAYWYVITDCAPRAIMRGDPVPFKFTGNGVKVQVALEDLLTAIDYPDPGYLEWHAAVRRIPFIYHPEGYPYFPNTTAADYAPDVTEFLDCGLPPTRPCSGEPEDPAPWEQRY